jgi:hypothetical protein
VEAIRDQSIFRGGCLVVVWWPWPIERGWKRPIMLMREEVVQAMENMPERAMTAVMAFHDSGMMSEP